MDEFTGTPSERAACEVICRLADEIVGEGLAGYDGSMNWAWDEDAYNCDGPEYFLPAVRRIARLIGRDVESRHPVPPAPSSSSRSARQSRTIARKQS